MVKLLLLIAFLPFYLLAADVKIDASIDLENSEEKQPLKGSISITHDFNDKIDEKSFSLEDKPLPVEFVQQTKLSPSSPLVITFYRFTIEGKPKGLYILPAIKAIVGGQEYQSLPTTYEVGETAVPSTKTAKTQVENTNVSGKILKLDAIIQRPAQLYPGQRITVMYRYTFNDNIELTKEVLPLLQGDGFLMIGAPEVKNENQGSVSISEVSQVLEAIKPGVYKFDASHVEGYVYRTETFGSGRIYLKPMLEADAPSQTITVDPFPEKGKPASFNGAIGPFTHFATYLKSPDHMNVGDKIVLELDLTGIGQIEHAPLPALCCLPGFSGVFSQSDIPPKEEIKGTVKSFVVEMRPLTANVKAIPSIEYAYFDPKTKSYGTLTSQPIPITVTALPVQPVQPQKKEEAAPPTGQFSKTPQPIEIYGNKKLKPSDVANYRFGSWWVLMGVPLALAALLLQLYLRKYLREHKPVVKVKTSNLYLTEALKTEPSSNVFYQLLSKALIMRLVEKGKLKDAKTTPEQLPDEGVAGEVKNLLTRIEEKRFTGQEPVVDAAMIEEAKALYRKI